LEAMEQRFDNANGMTAVIITLAMSFGLITPKIAIDYLSERLTQTKS
jgi:hypothetical protein